MSILKVEMQDNDANAKTIGEYLIKLSHEVWKRSECFSGKRPFGNSGWEYEIYEALVRANKIDGVIDKTGYLETFNRKQADDIIDTAFHELYKVTH